MIRREFITLLGGAAPCCAVKSLPTSLCGAGTDENLRDRHQPEDGQGARPHRAERPCSPAPTR